MGPSQRKQTVDALFSHRCSISVQSARGCWDCTVGSAEWICFLSRLINLILSRWLGFSLACDFHVCIYVSLFVSTKTIAVDNTRDIIAAEISTPAIHIFFKNTFFLVLFGSIFKKICLLLLKRKKKKKMCLLLF